MPKSHGMNFLSVQVSNIKLLTTIIRIMSKDMIVLFLTVSVPLWIVESAILLNIQNKRAYIVWAIHESPVIAAGASPRPTLLFYFLLSAHDQRADDHHHRENKRNEKSGADAKACGIGNEAAEPGAKGAADIAKGGKQSEHSSPSVRKAGRRFGKHSRPHYRNGKTAEGVQHTGQHRQLRP